MNNTGQMKIWGFDLYNSQHSGSLLEKNPISYLIMETSPKAMKN